MKHRWLWAWILQIAEMLAICLVAALIKGMSAALHAVLLWGCVPLAGLFAACQAVRRGLNNYAACIAPAACLLVVYLLTWGFSPPPGAALLTALTSLIGAAAGQVITEQGKNKRYGRHRRS